MWMTGERIRHRLVEPHQRRLVGPQVDLSLLYSGTEQGKRFKQPTRARIFGEFAEKGLGVDHAVDQGFELPGFEKQQPLLLQKGRCVGTPNGQEMFVVDSQALSQRGSRVLRFLRLLCVDDSDQQVLKLREELLERLGALPP